MNEQPGRTKRAIAALRRLDSGERLIALARAGRRRLPGDHSYGDPLSLAGDEPPQVIGRGGVDWEGTLFDSAPGLNLPRSCRPR